MHSPERWGPVCTGKLLVNPFTHWRAKARDEEARAKSKRRDACSSSPPLRPAEAMKQLKRNFGRVCQRHESPFWFSAELISRDAAEFHGVMNLGLADSSVLTEQRRMTGGLPDDTGIPSLIIVLTQIYKQIIQVLKGGPKSPPAFRGNIQRTQNHISFSSD